MLQVFTLSPHRSREWIGVLERSAGFDFYHTPGYHSLAEARGEGDAGLFGVEDGRDFVAVPLLVRPIAGVESPADGTGRSEDERGWRDATSVYGYPGPVASRPNPPAELLAGFRDALTAELRRRRVVALFSRLHPLLPQESLLTGMGEVVQGGETVSIDLALPAEERRRRYRTSHRYDVSRLRGLGFTCLPDPEQSRLDGFLDLYRATLDRVDGGANYSFERQELERLLTLPDAEAELMICRAGGGGAPDVETDLACAGIFLYCHGLVQYHLAATGAAHRRRSPLKLLVDAAADRAAARGARVLHLGGGVGGADDSLLHFKRGFSDRRHRFATWRWVVDPAAYAELCRRRGVPAEAATDPARGFFPAYRRPAPAAVAGAGVPT